MVVTKEDPASTNPTNTQGQQELSLYILARCKQWVGDASSQREEEQPEALRSCLGSLPTCSVWGIQEPSPYMENRTFHEGERFSTAGFITAPELPVAEQVGQCLMEAQALLNPAMDQNRGAHSCSVLFPPFPGILSRSWNN